MRDDSIQAVLRRRLMVSENIAGTFECPICAWPEPHAHTAEQIAERPHIDYARKAFEVEAHAFMRDKTEFKEARTGYWWANEARYARVTETDPMFPTAKFHGWSQRDYPQGRYSNDFVQLMWEFWRMAWLSAARRSMPPASAHEPAVLPPITAEIISQYRGVDIPLLEAVGDQPYRWTPAAVEFARLVRGASPPPGVGCTYELTDGPFLTGCGREFWLDAGHELYDFCPFCGKPVEETSPTKCPECQGYGIVRHPGGRSESYPCPSCTPPTPAATSLGEPGE